MEKFKVRIHGIGMVEACTCPACKKLCAIKIPATMSSVAMTECRSSDHIFPCRYYGETEKEKIVDKS